MTAVSIRSLSWLSVRCPASSITVTPGSHLRELRVRTIKFQDTAIWSEASGQQRRFAGWSGSHRRFRYRIALAGGKEQVIVQSVLARVHIPVAAAQGIQLGMRAPLDDVAGFDHQNLVGAADR